MIQLVVAFTSNKKKQQHFFRNLQNTASTWVGSLGPRAHPVTIKLIPLFEPDSHTLAPLPPVVHAVLHKRTDDMASAVCNSVSSDHPAVTRLATLHAVLHRHAPETPHGPFVSVDPLDAVWRLVDRQTIALAVERAFGHWPTSSPLSPPSSPSCSSPPRSPPPSPRLTNVCAPPWGRVRVTQGLSIARADLIDANLQFPVILKRRLACGTKASHEMVIAYDLEGAMAAIRAVFGADKYNTSSDEDDEDIGNHSEAESHRVTASSPESMELSIAPPCPHPEDCCYIPDGGLRADLIAQQFITRHGGVLFKVYAIGSKIVVQPRGGVRHTTARRGGYHYFDSQRLGRGEPYQFDARNGQSEDTAAVMPSSSLLRSVVGTLSEELRLSLIGVDLVFDVEKKTYFVVDVNYFPGYKGVGKAYEWVLQHVCNVVAAQSPMVDVHVQHLC